MSANTEALAQAVLLYFGDLPRRDVAREWRQTTGTTDFSATTLRRLARAVLDEQAAQERAARARERERKRSERARA